MKRLIPTRGSMVALVWALAVAALVAVPTAQAQPQRFPEPAQQQPVQITGGGTELFRALLDKYGIEPVKQTEVWNNTVRLDSNLIVIVIGTVTGEWDEGLRWVRRAIGSGGAGLVATDSSAMVFDHTRNPGGWNQQVGAFDGGDVTADWRNAKHTYDGHPDCPFAVPVSPVELDNAPERPGRVWSVFRGLTKVATNKPTCFHPQRFTEEYQYPLARFPDSARLNGARLGRAALFAIGNDGPARFNSPGYSFLAMADSSVFINQMVMETETENLELTFRTIEYLQGPEKSRKKCLFFENGRVVEKFDGLRDAVRPPRPKIPPDAMPDLGPLLGKNQDKLIEGLDKFADNLQTRDWIHNTLVGEPGSERERKSAATWVEGALVMASVAIVFLLLRRFWNGRHPQDVPPAPSTGGGVAATGPPGVFDRRQKELVRRNNVYEPVRNLTREFFASAGAPPNPGAGFSRMPKIIVTNAVRKPDSLRRAIRDMWRLAYGPPTAMTAQRWFELEPYFERIKQAHADGKWRFATDETWAS